MCFTCTSQRSRSSAKRHNVRLHRSTHLDLRNDASLIGTIASHFPRACLYRYRAAHHCVLPDAGQYRSSAAHGHHHRRTRTSCRHRLPHPFNRQPPLSLTDSSYSMLDGSPSCSQPLQKSQALCAERNLTSFTLSHAAVPSRPVPSRPVASRRVPSRRVASCRVAGTPPAFAPPTARVHTRTLL